MDRLISMVAFVLTNKYTETVHKNYANFLSQKLELWMFVTVMSNEITPTDEEIKTFEGTPLFEEYQEAKDRVLFEGFKLKGKYLWNKEKLFMISDNYNESFSNIKHIEWLLSNSVHEFILTESAKKQIEL